MRFYPQVLSLFVGFDNGDFFMLSHVAGESRARFRSVLKAPENAAFANKIVTAKDGPRTERWIFFDYDGNEVNTSTPRRRISIRGGVLGINPRCAVIMSS